MPPGRLRQWDGSAIQQSGTSEGDCASSVGELVAAYLPFARKYYSREGKVTSEYNRLKRSVEFMEPWAGFLTSEFRPIHLRQLREELVATGLARLSVNAYVNRAKRMFRWGTEYELVLRRATTLSKPSRG